MCDINSELFFQMEDGGRRGHDKKLFKRRFRLDYGNICLVIELLIIAIHCLHIALIVVT